jgi:hypothetical protein
MNRWLAIQFCTNCKNELFYHTKIIVVFKVFYEKTNNVVFVDCISFYLMKRRRQNYFSSGFLNDVCNFSINPPWFNSIIQILKNWVFNEIEQNISVPIFLFFVVSALLSVICFYGRCLRCHAMFFTLLVSHHHWAGKYFVNVFFGIRYTFLVIPVTCLSIDYFKKQMYHCQIDK